MAKLHILQLILLTWCILSFNTSDTNATFSNQLKKLIKPWMKTYNKNYQQVAALVMTDSTSLNNFVFEPSPISYEHPKLKIQPYPSQMINSVVALPLDGKHAEERVLERFSPLLEHYRKNHFGLDPTSILLYTYYFPCFERFSKKHPHSCTSLISDFVKLHAEELNELQDTKFYVAYSNDNTLNFNGCSCDIEKTKQVFKTSGIDLVKIPWESIQRMKFLSMINRE